MRKKFFILILCIMSCIVSSGQNRRGYAIDPQLKILSNFNPPVSKAIAPVASVFMDLMPKKIDKENIIYESFKVGDVKMHIMIPRSKADETTPCLFYIHGGGFIFKAHTNHYVMEQEYALGAGCRVVGIDYSLAPKYPFPTALNECLEGYRYMLANAEDLKIDTTRMMIGGDSAGGLLAMDTYLSLEVSERPAGLMLVYPVVDDSQTTPSMKRFDDTPAWNSVNNAKMWEWYLAGQEYRSPLDRHTEFDVQHLFVEVEEFDCLHDEGVMIYEVLSPSCGHSVLLDNKGTFHGYDINFKADITQESLRQRVRFLSESFPIDL